MQQRSRFASDDSELTTRAAATYIRAIETMMKQDRSRGLAALNDWFRTGRPPDPPLDGRYVGHMVAIDIAPVFTPLVQAIVTRWMPWQGKTFNPTKARGDNIFTRDSLLLAHLFWPLYRDFVDDGPATYRAFPFRLGVGAGLFDTDRQVLKIDYDLPTNPRLSVRRVLDELVEVANGFYLGKAHVHWWWGHWQQVAYFSLVREDQRR